MTNKDNYEEYYDDIELEYEDEEDSTDTEKKELFTAVSIVSLISIWFIRFGMVIAVILLLYYVIKLQILNAIIFIIGLIGAFLFGYFFMMLLDKFTEDAEDELNEEKDV